MQAVLDKSFPAEQKAILGASTYISVSGRHPRGFNPADPFHIMGAIMKSFRDERERTPAHPLSSRGSRDKKALEIQKIIAPVAGHTYQELSKAMQEFKIDKREIRSGNIGHDEDYNFKIIDSSIFTSAARSWVP